MLEKLLREVFGRRRPQEPAPAPADVEAANDVLLRVQRAHKKAPRDLHGSILFKNVRIGSADLVELVQSCLADSGSQIPPAKFAHRPLASLFLANYLTHAAKLPGARAECGVYSGGSALLICRTLQMLMPGYQGEDLHLIDSFEGLGDPAEEDFVAFRDPRTRAVSRDTGYNIGAFATSCVTVRQTLSAFPRAEIHQGWIPEVFATLPEKSWSFVHVDVDLYEPTAAALEYFYPRLVENGVMLCDDYGAALFPGARKAWDAFCVQRDLGYAVLDTGQAVLLKPPDSPISKT